MKREHVRYALTRRATIMLSYSGPALYDENWGLLVVVALVSLAIIGFFIVTRARVEAWLERRTGEFLE